MHCGAEDNQLLRGPGMSLRLANRKYVFRLSLAFAPTSGMTRILVTDYVVERMEMLSDGFLTSSLTSHYLECVLQFRKIKHGYARRPLCCGYRKCPGDWRSLCPSASQGRRE